MAGIFIFILGALFGGGFGFMLAAIFHPSNNNEPKVETPIIKETKLEKSVVFGATAMEMVINNECFAEELLKRQLFKQAQKILEHKIITTVDQRTRTIRGELTFWTRGGNE